jgi:HEAT repeat protein
MKDRMRWVLVAVVSLCVLAAAAGCDSAVYSAGKKGDVDALVAMAEDNTNDLYSIREVAVEQLGEIGTPEAVDALLAWLEQGPPDGLYAAVLTALGTTKDSRVIEPLLGELAKIDLTAEKLPPEEQTKVWAIMRSLALLPDERVTNALLQELDMGHASAISEGELAGALAGQGTAIAPELERRLAVADERVFRSAALALGSIYTDSGTQSRVLELLAAPDTFRIYPAIVDGTASVEPQALIDSLNAFGDVTMAAVMVNSSLEEWQTAAETWAAEHGYTIESFITAP